MSDDDAPRKGGGKGGSGGKNLEGGKCKGGKSGKSAPSSAPSITRLTVVPKFLQEIQERYQPRESKRGLLEATLADKNGPLGKIGLDDADDDFDVQFAQVVETVTAHEEPKSKLTAEQEFWQASHGRRKAAEAVADASKRGADLSGDENPQVKFHRKGERETFSVREPKGERATANKSHSFSKGRLSFDDGE
uniref:DUF4604 domain-containing protein n=1 Tax=Noctiluca scintillans TaxID=2966 RepID=A0A7S1ADE5_NOCSC